MKAWASEFMRAVLAVILLSFLLGAIYPLAAWGIGNCCFPAGQRLPDQHGDEIAGSALIAQPFTSPLYFHPRASAVDYSCSRANSAAATWAHCPGRLPTRSQCGRRAIAWRTAAGRLPDPRGCAHRLRQRLGPPYQPSRRHSPGARVARARG